MFFVMLFMPHFELQFFHSSILCCCHGAASVGAQSQAIKYTLNTKCIFKTILEEIIVLSSDDDDEGPVKKSSSSIGKCQFNLFMSQASLRSPNISIVKLSFSILRMMSLLSPNMYYKERFCIL